MNFFERLTESFAHRAMQRAAERDDDRFLEALQVVMNRARVEFQCPKCGSLTTAVHGIDECDIEHHVIARCYCPNCPLDFCMTTHQLIAAAGHAVQTFDTVEAHAAARALGIRADQITPDDPDDLAELGG